MHMYQTVSEQEWQQLQDRITARFGHLLNTDVKLIEHKGSTPVPLLEMPSGHAKPSLTKIK